MRVADRAFSAATMGRQLVRRRLVPKNRKIEQLVARNMALPDLEQRPREPGSVWAITMVKNEADIIVPVIQHMFDQGVHEMIVCDNGSTDGTLDEVRHLATFLPIHLATDTLVAFEQPVKMTRLADAARRSGADWVLPFDADEFWVTGDGRKVGAMLSTLPNEIVIVNAAVHNMFPRAPLAGDVTAGDMRFDLTPHERKKVAFRSHWAASLTIGNHNVFRGRPRADGLVVVHIPWRSREQLARKGSQGRRAMEMSQYGPDFCRHWRAIGDSDETVIEEMWTAVTSGQRHPSLLWAPVGPFADANPLAGDPLPI